MKKTLIFIGSFALTVILMSVPILTTLSWVFGWGDFIKFILIMGMIVEFLVLSGIIYYKGAEDE